MIFLEKSMQLKNIKESTIIKNITKELSIVAIENISCVYLNQLLVSPKHGKHCYHIARSASLYWLIYVSYFLTSTFDVELEQQTPNYSPPHPYTSPLPAVG